MHKLRIFVVELILVGLLVGWYLSKFPETLDPFIPWIVWAIFFHLTWEILLTRENLQAYVGRFIEKRKSLMMWVIAFGLGGAISIGYLFLARSGIRQLTEVAESQKEIAKKIQPLISWSDPQPIAVGIPLSDMQLNAKPNVSGDVNYLPEVGTLLPVGKHELMVNFTPTDGTKYASGSASVHIVVNPASPLPPHPQHDPTAINELDWLVEQKMESAYLDRSSNQLWFTLGNPIAVNITYANTGDHAINLNSIHGAWIMQETSKASIKKNIDLLLTERKKGSILKSVVERSSRLWFTVKTPPISREDLDRIMEGPPYVVVFWAIFHDDPPAHYIYRCLVMLPPKQSLNSDGSPNWESCGIFDESK